MQLSGKKRRKTTEDTEIGEENGVAMAMAMAMSDGGGGGLPESAVKLRIRSVKSYVSVLLWWLQDTAEGIRGKLVNIPEKLYFGRDALPPNEPAAFSGRVRLSLCLLTSPLLCLGVFACLKWDIPTSRDIPNLRGYPQVRWVSPNSTFP